MRLIKWLGLHPLLFLILMTSLGGIVGFLLTYISPYILWLSWKQAFKPPPKATHIVAIQSYMLYVEAHDAALYQCDLYLSSCTQIDALPKFNIARETLACPAIEAITPILVDNVVETHARRDCTSSIFGYTDTHVIVFADGSVWTTHIYYRYNSDSGGAYLDTISPLGAIVGCLLGMFILARLWTAESKNRRRRSTHSTSQDV